VGQVAAIDDVTKAMTKENEPESGIPISVCWLFDSSNMTAIGGTRRYLVAIEKFFMGVMCHPSVSTNLLSRFRRALRSFRAVEWEPSDHFYWHRTL
jgi:hypothetical protein